MLGLGDRKEKQMYASVRERTWTSKGVRGARLHRLLIVLARVSGPGVGPVMKQAPLAWEGRACASGGVKVIETGECSRHAGARLV